jgi:hypothetical protein
MSDPAVPHHYPLAVRDSGVAVATSLLLRSMPYALMRFAILLSYSVACIVWIVVTIGGAVWAGTHIAGVFGLAWFVGCVFVAGWLWATILRYVLHLVECGHVAVLTEFIVHRRVGNGSESMFAYGKRIVTERFGQVNVLFALNLLVRGVVNAVHNTIEGVGSLLPIPGLDGIAKLITMILRAATRYMDKVIFSYNLACGGDPWSGARDGLVYYAQNTTAIVKQAIWIVVLEHILTAVLWLALLVPAAAITAMLPHAVRESGGIVTVTIAILLALAARGAFLKPVFLVMVMVRFHVLIEHQMTNPEWVASLDRLSQKFRELGEKAGNYRPGDAAGAATAAPAGGGD